jgi:hypothetical protein
MMPVRGVIGWLPLVLLTACVASHPGERRAGTERPEVDRLLSRGDIQGAHFKFLHTVARHPQVTHLQILLFNLCKQGHDIFRLPRKHPHRP